MLTGMGEPASRPGAVSGPMRLVALALSVVLIVAAGVVGYRLGAQQAPGPTPAPVPVTLKPQPVDVGFAQDMTDHHSQAVELALLTINRATSQPVRTIALDVAADQRRELGILEQFLRDRGITQTDPSRTVMGWMGEPTPHDQMPGLATREQVVALSNAQDADVDRMFIDLMVRHHEGGVHMARYAAEHAETQYIRELAARMVVDQNREINDLRQLIADG